MSTAALKALAVHDEAQIVRAFQTRRAISGGSALLLAELGLNDSIPLRRMVLSAVLRKAGPDRYFLDETVWATRRRVGGVKLIRIALVLVLGLVVMAVFAIGR